MKVRRKRGMLLTDTDDVELETSLQELALNLGGDAVKTDMALRVDGRSWHGSHFCWWCWVDLVVRWSLFQKRRIRISKGARGAAGCSSKGAAGVIVFRLVRSGELVDVKFVSEANSGQPKSVCRGISHFPASFQPSSQTIISVQGPVEVWGKGKVLDTSDWALRVRA